MNKYIDQGIAELVPGVLFVDEVSLCTNVYIVHFTCVYGLCGVWATCGVKNDSKKKHS